MADEIGNFVPLKVNDLINKLKLLPGEWMVQLNITAPGEYYISDLEILDNCNVNLVVYEIPEIINGN